MPVFVDSGILLRAVHRTDTHYAEFRGAIHLLLKKTEPIFTGLQQLAEFCNVCTRPPDVRGGSDLSFEEAARRRRRIERGVRILTETPRTPEIWKTLVQRHGVRGVQVHDARTVALMFTHSLTDLLTLNQADFVRYKPDGLAPTTPTKLLASGVTR